MFEMVAQEGKEVVIFTMDMLSPMASSFLLQTTAFECNLKQLVIKPLITCGSRTLIDLLFVSSMHRMLEARVSVEDHYSEKLLTHKAP